MTRVELAVSEKEVGDVRVGQRVHLKVLSFPGRCFSGNVVEVAPAATLAAAETETSRRFVVSTLVDNEDLLLKPGMTGKAKIRCGSRPIPIPGESEGVSPRMLRQAPKLAHLTLTTR